MHIKLRVELSGGRWARARGGPIWLLLLAELVTVLGLLVGVGLRNVGTFAEPLLAERGEQPAIERQAAGQTAHGRKCEPMLNIVLPPRRHNASAAQHAAEGLVKRAPEDSTTTTTTTTQRPDSFAFAIDNIDMPLAAAASPVQSVMRLLSAFDGQLDGSDESDAPAELEAGGERAPENSIRFAQNKLHISDLNLTMLNVHLYAEGQPKFALAMHIGNATLAGRFAYNGPMPALMGGDLVSRLAGHYRMSIDSVLVTASSNLTKQRDSSQQQQQQLATSDLRVNISNLGYISIDILDATDSSKATSSYVLKMLQRVLQKTIKRTYNKFEGYIRQTLELEGRRFLDCELTRFSPLLRENQLEGARELLASGDVTKTWTNNLDDLARILSSAIRESRLDRVGLANFEHQRSVLGTSALIVFTNGSLAGLDNVRLINETRVKLQDEHLIVNASLGWFNLRPSYNWTLYLGGSASAQPAAHLLELQRQDESGGTTRAATARGFVSATIKAIEFETLISYRGLRHALSQGANRVTVDELQIRRLDGPKLDIGGLPGMNRLARATVNFFMARLKQRLVSSIQPTLKLELERALNRLAPWLR